MNKNVLQRLKSAERILDIPATLVDVKNQVSFEFLYNPSTLQYSRSANYKAAPNSLTSLPVQQYLNTTGRTLKLTELLMTSYNERKSLRSLLEDIQSLLVADVANKSLAPKPVYFVWGTEKFGPAYVTDLRWEITALLGGEPAEALLDITLIETADPTSPQQNATQEILAQMADESKKRKAFTDALENQQDKAAANSATATPEQVLTARQQEDAKKAAILWFSNNLTKLPAATQQLFNTGQTRLAVSSNGTVTLNRLDGSPVGTVGIYRLNDKSFDVSAGTLIQ